jgi:hypothetical protein
MDETRLNDWEPLFASALRILDAAAVVLGDFRWSFGGGTALMVSASWIPAHCCECSGRDDLTS